MTSHGRNDAHYSRLRLNLTSDRIKILNSMIDPLYGPVYDLCCDHGRLGLSALEKGAYVIFNDRERHLVDKVESNLSNHRPELISRARFQVGDASKINFPEKSQIIIAGVGNKLMEKIISRITPQQQCRLLLGVQRRSVELRSWLHGAGWKLECEKLAVERGRYREILQLSRQGHEIEAIGSFHESPPTLRLDFYNEMRRHFSMIRELPEGISHLLSSKVEQITK